MCASKKEWRTGKSTQIYFYNVRQSIAHYKNHDPKWRQKTTKNKTNKRDSKVKREDCIKFEFIESGVRH